MMNFPVTTELLAQHRKQLLAEAERDRLAREATAGAVSPATGMSGDLRLSVLSRAFARVRLALHRPAATPAAATLS
jgi:hypothetical protein